MGSVGWTALQRTAWSIRCKTGEKVSLMGMYSEGFLQPTKSAALLRSIEIAYPSSSLPNVERSIRST